MCLYTEEPVLIFRSIVPITCKNDSKNQFLHIKKYFFVKNNVIVRPTKDKLRPNVEFTIRIKNN